MKKPFLCAPTPLRSMRSRWPGISQMLFGERVDDYFEEDSLYQNSALASLPMPSGIANSFGNEIAFK